MLGAVAWIVAMLVLVMAGTGGAASPGTVAGSAALAPGAASPSAMGSAPGGTPPPASSAPAAPATFLLAVPRAAPPIELVDPNGRPFSLSSLRGEEALVFFGYTHCPDVCPATIGNLGKALADVGSGPRAIFVSIDPERDTPAWLSDYVRYIPKGILPVTGSVDQIRETAADWGVRYARVDVGSSGGYSMAHTADVFLVDATGMMRADFPFGTPPEAIAAVLRMVAASSPVAPSPSGTAVRGAGAAATAVAPPSAGTADEITPEVVSTSVWAGKASPVIVALNDASGQLNDPTIRVSVQLQGPDGTPVGPTIPATTVRPPGIERVSYVATPDIPGPGPWRIAVTAATVIGTRTGTADLTALDPGGSVAIGAPAPAVRTPTIADAGGDARAVTTDPVPDLRLLQQSTADALAAHKPFVLVVDSPKFRVSPYCGKALFMTHFLLDRWPNVAFVDLEPYVYTLVVDTPVLSGDIQDPPLSPIAAAWGVGAQPWGSRSMPWIFVVDGKGIVRAKYQGLMGSADVDVMLALLAQEQ